MKKNQYILAAIIAVVLIVGIVTASVLIARRAYIDTTGDADALYAYTVKKSHGGLTVTVKGKFPQNSLFHAHSATDAVAVTEKKSTSGKAVFELMPVTEGADTVSLCLEETGDLAEQRYMISLYLTVEDGNKITFIGSESASLGESVSKKDGEGLRYMVSPRGAGLCEISLLKQEPTDAYSIQMSTPGMLRILSSDATDTKQTYTLSAAATGELQLTFACPVRKAALKMTVHISDLLDFTFTDVEEIPYSTEN